MVLERISRNVRLLTGQFSPAKVESSILQLSTLEFAERLKREHGDQLRSMIEEAENVRGREVGAMLCLGPENTIRLGRECWGERHSVSLVSCPHAHARVGSFHVHLEGSDVYSVDDVEHGIEAAVFSCIGYRRAGTPMLKCIATQRYYKYSQDERDSITDSLA